MSGFDAVDGSSTGTRVPKMWVLLVAPTIRRSYPCKRFDADEAGRQLLKERQDVPPLQLPADHHPALSIHPVDLKNGAYRRTANLRQRMMTALFPGKLQIDRLSFVRCARAGSWRKLLQAR